MSLALTEPYEVSGTVHLAPALVSRLRHKTLSKENALADGHPARELHALDLLPQAKAAPRCFRAYGEPIELDLESSLEFWSEIARVLVLPAERNACLAHFNGTQSMAASLVASVRRHMKRGSLSTIGRAG